MLLWRCRNCDSPLGQVVHGVLRLTLPETVEVRADGLVWVPCRCGDWRTWLPRRGEGERAS